MAPSKTEEDECRYRMGMCKFAMKKYNGAYFELQSIEGPYKKDAMYLIAQAIAATKCGESTFDRKAKYWLANDFVRKAISAGLTGVSADKYLDRAPTEREAWEDSVKPNDEVNINCYGLTTIARF